MFAAPFWMAGGVCKYSLMYVNNRFEHQDTNYEDNCMASVTNELQYSKLTP